MSDIKYWDGWLDDNSKAPHEAISEAIDSANDLLVALKKLKPRNLKKVHEEIDAQVGKALRSFLEDADLYGKGTPGELCLYLADGVEKRFSIMDIAKDVAGWGGKYAINGLEIEIAKEEWALKFEKAAALIRAKNTDAASFGNLG